MTKTSLRIARCIYSGNEGYYDIAGQHWSKDKQERLNLQYMQKECDCKRCKEDREERKKLIEALKRNNATRELELLGE